MLDLPWGTHRSLIQPLTGEVHVKLILIRRFLCFIDKIRNSGKAPLTMLMKEAIKDVRSVTGSNMRNIMLLVGKTCVEDVKVEDVDNLEYFKLENDELWKIPQIQEIINVKAGNLEVAGFENDELEILFFYLCPD